MKINPQDTFAESLKGIYLVDAGAGTGKTHTIIRRYINLINTGVHPKDILLITFTRNAADQMRNDVVTADYKKEINVTELLEAPVLNFHAYCLRFLKKYGLKAPSIIGLDDILTGNFNIAEESEYESELFRKFYQKFRKNTFRKYENIYKSLKNDFSSVLNAIKKLCSIGIFPTDKEWFGSGGEFLKGNRAEFSELFAELNKECIGAKAENQNEMYKILNGLKEKIFFDFNFEEKIEGKRAAESLKEEIFDDKNQIELIDFMREVYFSYIKFMLSKNILNFDFVIMFAYLVLFTDEKIRSSSQFEYIMVDEFQDTDEIQFLLLMLLCREVNGSVNLGVVGDWKQGIYGFRNTTIENITLFSERLSEYKELLNKDRNRIKFNAGADVINKITFEYNYRSSQLILDFSMHTLLCRGKEKDEPDTEFIFKNFSNPLTAKRKLDDLSEIAFYVSKDNDSESETELILKKISELTNNEKYLLREFDNKGKVKSERRIRYSDICVLARTNEFGLKLQKNGIQKMIPVNFKGGLELFSSQQGILLLAWLRVMLNEKSAEGWIPILEKDGNKFNELKYLIDLINNSQTGTEPEYFKELMDFRNRLASEKNNLLGVIEKIFTRYGFEDEYSNAILTEFSKRTKNELLSPGDLANLIDSLKLDKFKTEISNTENAVVFQTIHGSKGLEYPVVILANMNTSVFPSSKNVTGNIYFNPLSGIRLRKQFGSIGEYSGVFDNWRSEVLLGMLKTGNYDEERRLLYVAATRAKQYLYFTSGRPSYFFKDLQVLSGKNSISDFEYDIKPVEFKTDIESVKISIPEVVAHAKKFVSVHTLMKEVSDNAETEKFDTESVSDLTFSNDEALKYGIEIHLAAQRIANRIDPDKESAEVKNIFKFIENCGADEIKAEADFLYPLDNEIVRGTIDLLLIYKDRVEIVDYKTGTGKMYLEQYKKQISIYKEVIEKIYPGKKVFGTIYFTGLNEFIKI